MHGPIRISMSSEGLSTVTNTELKVLYIILLLKESLPFLKVYN